MGRLALAGSLAVHAVAGGLLLSIEHEEAREAREAPIDVVAIEVIDAAPPAATTIEAVAGGGQVRSQRAADAPASQQLGTFVEATPTRRRVIDEIGPIAIEGAPRDRPASAGGGVELDGDGGDGMGTGGPRGGGIGLGDGGRIEVAREVPAPPPAPAAAPVSKARPARLIYPSRHREVEASELFVARITVDDEGYVVGARMVGGLHGPRDTEASQLIFRFRYAPALDADGRAIRSTFEQEFAVNW